MAKAQNPKPLIRAVPGKAKAAKKSGNKVEKQTSVADLKSVKGIKKQKLGSLVKEDIKTHKNKKVISLIKKEKEIDTKATHPKITKPLVLAPAESPTQKQTSRQSKKVLAKPTENGTVIKNEQNTADVKVAESSHEKQKQLGKNQKIKKAKSTESALESVIEKVYEAVPVEEEDFDAIVSKKNVLKVVNALKTLVEKEVATKKTSIFGDYNYCLNVSGFKIASCPKRIYKLNLKHSIIDIANDDVLIIVPDLKRGAKVEFESTIEHYTNLFQEAGIEGLKIMPFNQLRNEYKAFEAKRKLAGTYDYYLCDGRIAGQVAGFCGTAFQKPRTTFHAVRMENPKALKAEIEKALRRTAYKQLRKGDLITIPVGSDKLTPEKVVENILEVVSQLKVSYPGGLGNIRGLDIKVNILGTSSLPIYASTSNGPDEVPYVVGPREQRMLKLKKETNEVLAKFSITKDAEVISLSGKQLKRKRELKKLKSALTMDQSEASETDKKETLNAEVPTKKPRKDPKVAEKKVKIKAITKKAKQA